MDSTASDFAGYEYIATFKFPAVPPEYVKLSKKEFKETQPEAWKQFYVQGWRSIFDVFQNMKTTDPIIQQIGEFSRVNHLDDELSEAAIDMAVDQFLAISHSTVDVVKVMAKDMIKNDQPWVNQIGETSTKRVKLTDETVTPELSQVENVQTPPAIQPSQILDTVDFPISEETRGPIEETQAPVEAPVEATQAPVEAPVEATQAPVEATQAPVEATQAVETTDDIIEQMQ